VGMNRGSPRRLRLQEAIQSTVVGTRWPLYDLSEMPLVKMTRPDKNEPVLEASAIDQVVTITLCFPSNFISSVCPS
jgi:hypothetical protein